MATVIVLFNLKSDASKDAYEEWASKTDVPTVKGLASVTDFRVFRASGLLGSPEKSPYQYIEIIEILDMDQFGADISTSQMQKVAQEFGGFADNPTFMLTDQSA